MNTEVEQEFVSRGEAETEAFGGRLARSLPAGSVVALEGDLGAGKTVLARGFARGLGIEEAVSSPTYTILQEYPLPQGEGYFYHMDLYRIADERSALDFGVDEYLSDPDSYALIEWPMRIAGILPPATVFIRIEDTPEGYRRISINPGAQ